MTGEMEWGVEKKMDCSASSKAPARVRERDAEIIWYVRAGGGRAVGVKNEVLQLPSLVLIAFPCVRRPLYKVPAAANESLGADLFISYRLEFIYTAMQANLSKSYA
jgi:hypothetical protein